MLPNSFLFKAVYQNEDLPPPYKHTYIVEVHTSTNGLKINYSLHYLDREKIDEEEIYAEGFTLEDDFNWKGELKSTWRDYTLEFLKKTTFQDSKQSPLSIQLSGQSTVHSPDNIQDWDYFMQELTQAIFEEGGREAPLEITYAEISKHSKLFLSFVISFAERSLVLFKNTEGKEVEKKLDWKVSKNIMNTVYSLEYIGEKALLNPPKKEGKFIDIGEGAWYQFGVAVLNPRKKTDILLNLEKMVKGFL